MKLLKLFKENNILLKRFKDNKVMIVELIYTIDTIIMVIIMLIMVLILRILFEKSDTQILYKTIVTITGKYGERGYKLIHTIDTIIMAIIMLIMVLIIHKTIVFFEYYKLIHKFTLGCYELMIKILMNQRQQIHQRQIHIEIPNQINSLKIKKKKTNNELDKPIDEECSICFENHLKNDIFITKCNHIFGKNCLNMWLKDKYIKTCPNCRNICVEVTELKKKTKKTKQI